MLKLCAHRPLVTWFHKSSGHHVPGCTFGKEGSPLRTVEERTEHWAHPAVGRLNALLMIACSSPCANSIGSGLALQHSPPIAISRSKPTLIRILRGSVKNARKDSRASHTRVCADGTNQMQGRDERLSHCKAWPCFPWLLQEQCLLARPDPIWVIRCRIVGISKSTCYAYFNPITRLSLRHLQLLHRQYSTIHIQSVTQPRSDFLR